ncbi:MAG: serine hydrolase [Planctomycetota bacterium]
MARSHLLPLLLLVFATLAPRTATQVVAYHNQTSAQHQSQFNTLSAQGYRMISLSIYDNPASPLFAAVWVRRSGPGWIGFHNVDSAGYQNLLNTWRPQGYVPKILSATGLGSAARFAGVFEHDTTPYLEIHDATESAFSQQDQTARDQGYRLIMATIYGNSLIPQFAGVWRRNDENISWNWSHSSDATEFQQHFNAYTSAWVRPVHIDVSSFGDYLAIWNDNQLQNGWVAQHDMTSSAYQTAVTNNSAAGRYPIAVQAGGTGSATRFAAIFASSETVASRSFTMTGMAVPELAAFDSWVQQFMQDDAIRAGALAVIKDGRLMLARGYTWAEPGYPITQPTSLFRIASTSKSLTSIAIHQHMARSVNGVVNDTRTMLSFFPVILPQDLRTVNITLLDLLTHRGGWDISNTGLGFDPMFHDDSINAALGGTLPVTKADIFQYMTTRQSLQFNPGSYPEHYSNYGFSQLGRVLESLNPGMTYEQILQRDVFAPLGVTRARMGDSLLSQAAPGEVRYHPKTPGIRQSVMLPVPVWVPSQYGGWNQRNFDSHGGWIMAAPDYAKVLASFSLGDQNPLLDTTWTNHMWQPTNFTRPDLLRGWWRANVFGPHGTLALRWHNGGLRGTATLTCLREDGIGFCLFFNRDHGIGPNEGGALGNIANQVSIWPNHDLFPSVGIPSIRSHVAGTTSSFGRGCSGTAGVPAHTVTGTAETGQIMNLRVGGVGSGTPVVAMLGFSNSAWLGSRLPRALDAFGAPGCDLLVSPDLTFAGASGILGTASFAIPVPDDPSLIGLHLYSQFAVGAGRTNTLGLVFSNGVDTRLGGWR